MLEEFCFDENFHFCHEIFWNFDFKKLFNMRKFLILFIIIFLFILYSVNNTNQMSKALRTIKHIIKSVPTSDGQGVKLSRSIGMPPVSNLDPFLLLDEFKSDNVC